MDFYVECSKVLQDLSQQKGSVKSLAFSSRTREPKRCYALILSVVKHCDALQEVINRAQLLRNERILSSPIALILVHEHLLGKKGIIASRGPLKDAILRNKTRIAAEWVRVKLQFKKVCPNDQGSSEIKEKTGFELDEANIKPLKQVHDNNRNTHATDTSILSRWVRRNYLKCDDQTWTQFLKTYHEYIIIDKDEQVPGLVALKSDAPIVKDRRILNGLVVIQDKASCLPPVILSPRSQDTVLDTCAAPGNKTNLLANLMFLESPQATQNLERLTETKQVIAIEKDVKRYKSLLIRMSNMGSDNIQILNEDFLKCDPCKEPFSNVTKILLDPSCSGSGIISRMDNAIDKLSFYIRQQEAELQSQTSRIYKKRRLTSNKARDKSEFENDSNQRSSMLKYNFVNKHDDHVSGRIDQKARLDALTKFQKRMIEHSMSFPKVKRIVYSTCSVNTEENELVVEEALKSEAAEKYGWLLAPRSSVLPDWSPRGRAESCSTEYNASSMLRCEPNSSGTIGFFVACFIRVENMENASNFNPNRLDCNR